MIVKGEKLFYAYFTYDEKYVKTLPCVVISSCDGTDQTFATISPIGNENKEILIDVEKEYLPCYDSTEGTFDVWGRDQDRIIQLTEKYVVKYFSRKIASLTDAIKKYTDMLHEITRNYGVFLKSGEDGNTTLL